MTTAGVFLLITNDGRQDKMIMASDLLKSRLAAVCAARQANPTIGDPTPTLLDIERTHILFTNAHFKPFAAIGFEYNKTTPTSGNADLGNMVVFSLPQFGDFFHDMVLHVVLNQPTLTNADGVAVSNQPLMRWCPFPGERLLETVEFEVNGNPLDKYFDFSVNFKREFHILPHKQLGWNRIMGQEEIMEGFVDQPTWVGNGVAASAVTTRQRVEYTDGDQTPSGQKSTTVFKELLIPLDFWCCTDVRLAVPSVSIPYGQRFIKVQLCTGDKLVNLVPRGTGGWTDATVNGALNYNNMLKTIELYINNIFVNPEVHNIFIKRIGFNLIRVHRQQMIQCPQSSGTILLNQLKWPCEHLYVGMRLRDYGSTDAVLRRQNLDRWHKFSKVNDLAVSNLGFRSSKLITISDAFNIWSAAATGTFNNDGAATAHLTLTCSVLIGVATTTVIAGDWLDITTPAGVTLSLQVAVGDNSGASAVIRFTAYVGDVTALLGVVAVAAVARAQVLREASVQPQTSTVQKCVPTIDNLTITAHGITIYNNYNNLFYNGYIPYHYGGPNVQSPKDIGAMLIPFNLYPGTYQPSGHINLSRAREFYLDYTSSVIGDSTPGNLIVVASAINFLLISDGSAVLRYST
jgi:hypothetical protein